MADLVVQGPKPPPPQETIVVPEGMDPLLSDFDEPIEDDLIEMDRLEALGGNEDDDLLGDIEQNVVKVVCGRVGVELHFGSKKDWIYR